MDRLHAFHKTSTGSLVFALIELALLYIVASVAIDTANMFAYFAGVVLILGILVSIFNMIKFRANK